MTRLQSNIYIPLSVSEFTLGGGSATVQEDCSEYQAGIPGLIVITEQNPIVTESN